MAMTDTLDTPAWRPSGTKLDWGHALRSLKKLLDDKEDTRQVFEIMRALNGASTAKGYHKLLTTAQGGRIAYERPEFAQKLMDDAWLDSLPEGSVGAAYRTFSCRPTASSRSAGRARTASTNSTPTPGSAAARAMCTTSGISCPAITATRWAKPAWSASPTPRPRAWAGP